MIRFILVALLCFFGVAAFAQEAVVGSGVTGGTGAASGNSYVASAVHQDIYAAIGNGSRLRATASFTTSTTVNTAIPVLNCPAGVTAGNGVSDFTIPSGSDNLGTVVSCSGTTLTISTTASAITSASASDVLFAGTPLGGFTSGTDPTKVLISFWGRIPFVQFATGMFTNFNSILFGSLIAAGSSTEHPYGIDLGTDSSGWRWAIGDSGSLAGGNNYCNSSTLHSLALTMPYSEFPVGVWHHFLWAIDTSQTPSVYDEVFMDGVQVTDVTFQTAGQPCTSQSITAVGLSDPAGFQVGSTLYGNSSAYFDVADFMLWSGISGLPGHTGAQTVSGSVLSCFYDASHHPNNPTTIPACLSAAGQSGGTLQVELTGPVGRGSGTYLTNGGSGGTFYPSYGFQVGSTASGTTNVLTFANGGLSDVPNISPSYVSGANTAGVAAGSVGLKWVCPLDLGTVSSSVTGTCGQPIGVGDLLVAVFATSKNSAITCTNTPADNNGSLVAWQTIDQDAGTLLCVGYRVATAGENGVFTETLSVAASSAYAILLDYASGGATSTVAVRASSTMTGTTNSTAMNAGSVGATAGDLLLAIYEMWRGQYGPFTCNTTLQWNERYDAVALSQSDTSTKLNVLMCDYPVAGTLGSAAYPATSNAAYDSVGVMLDLYAQ